MKFGELRKVAERHSKERYVPVDEVDLEVSVCPMDEEADLGIRYFGKIHEMINQAGSIMICADGERNIPRADDLETLRQSVRRLVGEWETEASDYEDTQRVMLDKGDIENAEGNRMASWAFSKCSLELSALIDGKDSKQTKL